MQERIFTPRKIIEPLGEDELLKFKPDFSNMENCIKDAKEARLDSETGPEDPTVYRELLDRLEACRG